MNANLQIQLATKAGKVNHPNYAGKTWKEEYEYHLGMVDNPLPFELFRMKFSQLNRMFDNDPEGRNNAYDAPIQSLCNQLGY